MVWLVSCVCCVVDQDLSSCPFLCGVYGLAPTTNSGRDREGECAGRVCVLCR